EVGERNVEDRVVGETREHVVSSGAVLQRARGLDAVLPNSLVHDLSVAAGTHGPYDQLFRRHERQLLFETATDARRVDFETAHDVFHQNEDRIRGEKTLWDDKAAVGAVVERALE